jgi:hypothetical protein
LLAKNSQNKVFEPQKQFPDSPGLKLPQKKEEKKSTAFVMTFTTISPKNQFKKLAA